MFKPRRPFKGSRPQTQCSLACRPQCKRTYSSPAEQRRQEGHRRRAVKRAVTYEAFEVEEIYERDGWRCGICSKPVNPKLKYPHYMSASLDHIVPLSKGGAHVRSNAQCSHWICNSRKTDGPGGQLLLFG
ncbi:HNH endonuclease [Mesorhizobium sp. M2E.F.Ca.ET.166.01.1.1]|nr:HNH endonuclease [Mesorhizobium sp. M2E.F.Ca.ET.166.01.1.1]TGW04116.1 HNH endonuclease [Mesorhizobium sp. M2E.F.Ca.ET.154.01.1.1]